jgi:ATP-dependent Clp endopeptidase proteolytic subunit ClpP
MVIPIYTIDENADEPIMLINKHIGYDENMGVGIVGDEFQKELLYLDTLGKKRIKVYINSVGGSVIDGMSIYSAILKSSTPVDTYNVGLAASTAGWLFLAGRKRYMSDYAKLMMHNPYGDDSQSKGLLEFKDSIATMLANRCKLTKDRIESMMNAETWLNPDECKGLGLCEEIEITTEQNRKYMSSITDLSELWRVSNSLIKKNKSMKNVCEKLGLQPDATEQEICEAIDKMATTITETTNKVVTLEQDREANIVELTDIKLVKETLESDLATAQNKIADLVNAENKNKATALVNSYKNRLGDATIEVVNTWVEKAITNFTETKSTLESLPINMKAPKINVGGNDTPTFSAATLMAEINNKNTK